MWQKCEVKNTLQFLGKIHKMKNSQSYNPSIHMRGIIHQLIITQEVTSFLISDDIRGMEEVLAVLEIIAKKEDEGDALAGKVEIT